MSEHGDNIPVSNLREESEDEEETEDLKTLLQNLNTSLKTQTKNNALASTIGLMPKFSGEKGEDVKFFFTQFENIADLHNLTAAIKAAIVKVNLTGPALEFLRSSEELHKSNKYCKIKRELVNKFQKHETFADVQGEFNGLQQKPSQTIGEIAVLVEKAADKLTKNLNKEDKATENFVNDIKLNKFLQAIRGDIKLEIQKLGAKTFKEAVIIGKRVENAVEEANVNNVLREKQTEEKRIEELQAAAQTNNALMQQVIAELNNVKSKSEKPLPEVNKTQIPCLVCGKMGHLTAECWYHPKNFQNPQNYFQHQHSVQNRPQGQNRGRFYGQVSQQRQDPAQRNFRAEFSRNYDYTRRGQMTMRARPHMSRTFPYRNPNQGNF